MAKWRKRESLGRALAREGGSIAKGVGKELFSIATLGLFSPRRYPNKPRSGISAGESRRRIPARSDHYK